MEEQHRLKYLTISSNDRRWGIVVNSVGYQSKDRDADHPVGIHPSEYSFSKEEGRVLNCFQLHQYLGKGEGFLKTSATGFNTEIPLEEGDMFLLFPGIRHSYAEKDNALWSEFWIGFEGRIPSEWVEKGLLSPECPVFRVGLRNDVAELYKTGIEIAITQRAGYQQMLGSIAHSLLSSAIYYDKISDFKNNDAEDIIIRARIIVDQQLSSISPESLAETLEIGYSKFRKLFKDYTGFSPGQYISEIRIMKAKELLASTDMSVKAIAMEVGFNDQDYFVTAFKKHTGCRPGEFRMSSRRPVQLNPDHLYLK